MSLPMEIDRSESIATTRKDEKKMQQTQGIMSVVKSFHVIVHIATLNITWKHKTRSKVEKKSNKRPDIEMKF